MSLEELPGQWQAVQGHGDTYVRTAKAIEAAIAHLHAIRDDEETVAKAVDRVRDTAAEVSIAIAAASSRYETTGVALLDYAEELRLAQRLADESIERWRAADARADEAARERMRLEALATDDAAAAAATELRVAEQRSIEALETAARSDAEAAWRAARDRRDEAAARAESRISDELRHSSLHDSLWDDVRGAVAHCLDAVAEALVELLELLAATIVTAIAVVVAAALAIAVAATGLVGLLIAGLALLAIATWVVHGGAEAFIRTLVLTGSVEAALVSGVLAWLIGSVPGAADWLVDGDRGEPVPVWHGELPPTSRDAGTPGDRLARLQADNRAVDAHAGGPGELDPAASTMVAVTAVTTEGPSGRATVYRVAIPSTQAWTPGSSSLNDIHSGVAAKLGSAPTQLELAVRQAMAEAGVPAGASVLLSGWSLGGITAVNLAADPAFADDYDIDAVIVAGASIDDAAVPVHIPLLAFEHRGGDPLAIALPDPVPHTEHPGKERFDGDPNRTVVRVEAPDGSGFVPHDGLAYQATMHEQGNDPGSAAGTWMALHDLDRYFTGVERTHASIFVRGR